MIGTKYGLAGGTKEILDTLNMHPMLKRALPNIIQAISRILNEFSDNLFTLRI